MGEETMVERVARALCTARSLDPDAPCTEPGSTQKLWQLHVPHARAALNAMRDPTDAMVTAAGDWSALVKADETHPHRRGVWRAMIDAAMKDA